MTSVDDIKNIIVSIQNRREQWRLSTRQKNLLTLSRLGIDQEVAFDRIHDLLTWKNYISGPIADNHQPPVPSDVWVFGLDINGLSCYLKFQDRPSGVVIWISLHEAEYPLYFPYR
ncbi:hypothetical protein [Liquorilactobacillus nagelii]|uniref:hypothetical protein n=1 Tax=Liquorilactobacillus nagelii TaxID=82688 RepID=UPI00070F520A|nr:hypothetical protein [Liquorilactobacillus nagelii]QYH54159.1 hypothetical protein G6O73_05445 [Liquorilactobacillus nagelii DSM 13675]